MGHNTGRVAVITGGGTGIGAAVANELANSGAHVIVVSRGQDRLQSVVSDLRDQGHLADALVGDVTSEQLLTDLDALVPAVDILVNNAAVFAPYGSLEEISMAAIDEVLEVDLRAVLRLTRHFLPGMKARRFGRVINIGSIAASLGAANQAAYSTAKSALQGLTRSVALSCINSGVTCNLIEPGLVATERASTKIDSETRASLVRATPAGRPGTPEEVAHCVAYLASSGAAPVTGAILPVDGGIGIR